MCRVVDAVGAAVHIVRDAVTHDPCAGSCCFLYEGAEQRLRVWLNSHPCTANPYRDRALAQVEADHTFEGVLQQVCLVPTLCCCFLCRLLLGPFLGCSWRQQLQAAELESDITPV